MSENQQLKMWSFKIDPETRRALKYGAERLAARHGIRVTQSDFVRLAVMRYAQQLQRQQARQE